jgi:hypothetical protein
VGNKRKVEVQKIPRCTKYFARIIFLKSVETEEKQGPDSAAASSRALSNSPPMPILNLQTFPAAAAAAADFH